MSDDDAEDPFERLDDGDREGDPFERLDDDREGEEARTEEDAAVGTDTTESLDDIDRSDPESASPALPGEDDISTSLPGEDDPFAGMESREGDPFEGGESAFERVDVDGVDADEVWAEITDDGDGESVLDEEFAGGASGEARADVSKHRYCEQCEFFSAPPAAHCTHEEAEILEFLDMETVRVTDCPVVAQQRELDGEE